MTNEPKATAGKIDLPSVERIQQEGTSHGKCGEMVRTNVIRMIRLM